MAPTSPRKPTSGQITSSSSPPRPWPTAFTRSASRRRTAAAWWPASGGASPCSSRLRRRRPTTARARLARSSPRSGRFREIGARPVTLRNFLATAGSRTIPLLRPFAWVCSALATPGVLTNEAMPSAEPAMTNTVAEAKRRSGLATLAKLPLHFEANAGQFDPAVKFGARGVGHQLFLTGSESVLVLQKPRGEQGTARRQRALRRAGEAEIPVQDTREPPAVLRVSFHGANPDANVVGGSPLPGKSH